MLIKSILLSLLFSFSVLACDNYPFVTAQDQNNTTYGLFAPKKLFENAPKWQIGKSEPPLNLTDASRLFHVWAKSFYPQFDSVTIERVTLQSPHCLTRDDWIYFFMFVPKKDGRYIHGSHYFMAITMDKKIIEPKVVSNS